jgi:nitrogen-specific signal transduction histidine kinase/CheY-like chemotaxis protein
MSAKKTGSKKALDSPGSDLARQTENERKSLDEKFSQLQKMEAIGRLAGGVAHDYNNMLQIILGNTELLLTTEKLKNPQIARLKEIETAGRRAADLTRQLLAFACKELASPEVLEMNHTIESMLDPLRKLLKKDIGLFWTPSAEPCLVKMDPSQLNRILSSLIVNACDAITGSGRIEIKTAAIEFDEAYTPGSPEFLPSPYVLLTVSDNGCGMDEDMLNCIFEPFFTTKPEYLGCGLGLASLYGIVQQNKGVVRVDSQVGQGTSFRIYLPRQIAEKARPAEQHKQMAAPSKTASILLVEDEASLLFLCRKHLEEQGYSVFAFADPIMALELARRCPDDIHLILTDVSLPKMQGYELARRITALRPQIKCIFMSGYSSDILCCRQEMDNGDIHFLQKPFRIESMIEKIRELLDPLAADRAVRIGQGPAIP